MKVIQFLYILLAIFYTKAQEYANPGPNCDNATETESRVCACQLINPKEIKCPQTNFGGVGESHLFETVPRFLCPLACRNLCQCKEGYARNKADKCVEVKACGDCDQATEQLKECDRCVLPPAWLRSLSSVSKLPFSIPFLSQPNQANNTKTEQAQSDCKCLPSCECKEGFSRSYENGMASKCVPKPPTDHSTNPNTSTNNINSTS